MGIDTKMDLGRLDAIKKDQIDPAIAEYHKAYEAIYTAKTELRESFKGKDSEKFASQLDGFRDDFVALETLLNAYSAELERIRSTYQTLQDRMQEAASLLTDGNYYGG